MQRDLLYSSRKLRRRRFFRNIFFFLGFLIVCAALVVVFFSFPYLRVRTIVFFGNRALSTAELQQEIARTLASRHFLVLRGDNLIALRSEKLIAALIGAFPRIEYAGIKKDYPDTITFTLKERDINTVWCRRGEGEPRCAFVGQDGILFQEAPVFEGRVLLKIFDERVKNDYHIGESILSPESMRMLAAFRELFARRLNAHLHAIRIKDENAIELQVLEGWYAIVSAGLDPNESVENLNIVFAKNLKNQREKLEYIDLRFGNKLYYKLQ